MSTRHEVFWVVPASEERQAARFIIPVSGVFIMMCFSRHAPATWSSQTPDVYRQHVVASA